MKNFMGKDGFQWFVGVVEDRQDPKTLGRVRVRCLGYHTEDLIKLPTKDLPWAHPMNPITSATVSGIGQTPLGVVEGTWVVGFFTDGPTAQQPVIMGSLPGNPQNEADITKGFNDLSGNYPSEYRFESGHGLDESDVSRLARDEDAETHLSLVNRRATQFKDIPTATKPNVSTVSTASVAETVGTFDEPTPRGYEPGTTTADVSGNVGSGNPTGEYPFNHVHESESGHIKEIDDTPDGERLYTQHAAGTYEEIIADGTKTVKVVGDNYELVAGKSNIYVRGDINLTCSGTKRELIEGDYILEVGGDFTRKIGKSEQVKIGAGEAGGNLEEEIKGNYAFNIANSVVGAVGTTEKGTAKDYDITIGGKETRSVGGSVDITSTDNYQITSLKSLGILAQENLTTFSVASTSISAGTTMTVKAATNLDIKSEAVGTLLFSGDGSTVTANNGSGTAIELTGHVHSQGADSRGDTQTNTNAPVA